MSLIKRVVVIVVILVVAKIMSQLAGVPFIGGLVAAFMLYWLIKRRLPSLKWWILSLEQRRLIACHEAGHAVMAWLVLLTKEIEFVTVRPKKLSAVGIVSLRSCSEVQDIPNLPLGQVARATIAMLHGGIVGEALIADELKSAKPYVGSLADTDKASRLALSLVGVTDPTRADLKKFSEDLTAFLDKPERYADSDYLEAFRALKEGLFAATLIIRWKKEEVRVVAEALLERGTLYPEDLEKILGPRPKFTGSTFFKVDIFE